MTRPNVQPPRAKEELAEEQEAMHAIWSSWRLHDIASVHVHGLGGSDREL